jgi:hypothetical protein
MNVKAADQIKYDENEFGASINSKKKCFGGWESGPGMLDDVCVCVSIKLLLQLTVARIKKNRAKCRQSCDNVNQTQSVSINF